MSVQARTNNTNYTFVLNGTALDRENMVLEQDAGRTTVLPPFTVFGRKISAVPTTGTLTGTGDGTCTAVAALGPEVAQVGSYNLECTAKIATGGVFKLEGPNGELIADGLIITLTAATIFNAGGMTFTLTPGATDFEVADAFAIVVTAVNKLIPLDPTAVDGSQFFDSIYTQAEITAAAIVAGDVADIKAIIGGKACVIDEDQLVFENSVTVDTVLQDGRTVKQAMADIGIFMSETQDISNFENA